MSLLDNQITELIKDKFEYQDENLNVCVKFDKKFIGFDGHFPNNPVLPGVVMIKVIIKMYELYKKKEFSLSQIKQAKFIEPVLADTMTSFFVKSENNINGIKLQGKVLKSDKIIAKLSLVLQE